MPGRYHFIGIGGIGMSGVAQLFLRRGHQVSGSDLKENKNTRELASLGAKIFLGHDPGNLAGADAVVYSSAIKEDNPELSAARRSGIPLLMRAQALAGLMRDKIVITVAGSHGKTTVTSLASCLLLKSGLSPTVAVGGILRNIDTNACAGSGDFFVAEADESDGSFLYYRPKYSIVTNIDHEHLDYYGDFGREVSAFEKFIRSTDSGGCVFCSGDDPSLKKILQGYKNKYVLFGLGAASDIYPKNIKLNGLCGEFDCFLRGKFVARFGLALGGEHNISNALAVIALGLELGIDLKFIQETLSEYKGTLRRLEVKFKDPDYTVIDDYAHHPTEIRATLKAVANLKAKRLIAVFQPHRFTRTQLLWEEFGRSFKDADYLIITDIYAAGEPPLPGIDGRRLCAEIKKHTPGKEVHFMPKEEIVREVLAVASPGDLILTLGAGDIFRLSDELAEKFRSQA